VRDVAVANVLPVKGRAIGYFFNGEGSPALDPAKAPTFWLHSISPTYFQTMTIPLIRGRAFTAADTAASHPVGIINEAMARRFWPDAHLIATRLTLTLSADEQPREIVGVARDTPSFIGENQPEPMLYIAFAQRPAHVQSSDVGTRIQMSFMLRTIGDPLSAIPAVRHAAAQVDPEMPVSDIELLDNTLGRAFQYPRAFSLLLGVFAGAAILLAAIGIYGVMAYGVTRRTSEIGVRMALGAVPGDVVRMVLRETILLAVAGIVIGIPITLWLTRLTKSFLFGLEPNDPMVLAVAVGSLLAVCALAGWLPARRAARIDPTVALRYE